MRNIFIFLGILVSINCFGQGKVTRGTSTSQTTQEIRDSLNTLWAMVDQTPSVSDSVEVGSLSSDTIIWYFDEVYGTLDTSMFKVFQNDNIITDLTITTTDSTIKIKLEENIVVGSRVIVDYTQVNNTGLQDKFGNLKLTSVGNVVINNVTAILDVAIELALYDWEQTTDASDGVYNGTASAGFNYLTDEPILHDYIGDFNGEGKSVDLDSIPLTTVFFTANVIKAYGTNETYRTIWTNGDMTAYWNSFTGEYFFENINGLDTTRAVTNDSLYSPGKWQHVVYNIDTVNNSALIWIDGDYESIDTIIDAGFDFTDSITIGSGKAGQGLSYSVMDAFRVGTGQLINTDVSNLFNGTGIEKDTINRDPPIPDTAVVLTVNSFEITFYPVLANTTLDTAAFDLTAGGTPIPIYDPQFFGGKIVFSCDSISSGPALSLVYTANGNGDLEDAQGNKVVNFTQAVGNPLTGDAFLKEAHYRLDGTVLDDLELNDGVASGSFTYYGGAWAGVSAGNFDGSNRYIYSSAPFAFGTSGTLACAIRYFGTSGTDYTIAAWPTGRWAYDKGNGRQFFEVYGETPVYSTSSLGTTSRYIPVAIQFDTVTNKITFYTDGDSTTTVTLPEGLDINTVLRWGADHTGSDQFWGYIDEPMVFSDSVPTSKIKYINDNPGVMPDPDGSIDPDPKPTPVYSDIEIEYQHTFDTNTLGDYDWEEWKVDMNTTWRNSGPPGPGNADTVRIIDTGTDTVVQVGLKANTVGTYPNYATDYSDPDNPIFNLGSGEHTTNWVIEDESAEPQEKYFSINVKYSADFDFSKGGKVMVPFGGGPTDDQGATKPDFTGGFSVLLMWNPGGVLSWYIYHQDCPDERYGQTFDWVHPDDGVYIIPRGVTFNITARFNNNTPGNHDGFVEGWINGVMKSRVIGLQFLSTYNTGRGFNRWEFAHFRGGSSVGYFGSIDALNWFDDITIYKYTNPLTYPAFGVYSDWDQIIYVPWSDVGKY